MDKLKIKFEVKEYILIQIPPVPTVPRRRRKKLNSDTQQEKSPLIVHQEDIPIPIPIISLIQ
jgi:hypothetical protein